MKTLMIVGALVVALHLSACVNMHDCCECLFEGAELACAEPRDECIDKCEYECQSVDACRCIAAERADCSAECGCDRGW